VEDSAALQACLADRWLVVVFTRAPAADARESMILSEVPLCRLLHQPFCVVACGVLDVFLSGQRRRGSRVLYRPGVKAQLS
jgi:hypothetical protein